MQKNRRLSAREPVILEVEPKGDLIGKKYWLRNISQGGFGLETDQCMAEGERFDISFSLPGTEDIISLCGRVIWVKKVSSMPENYYIGLAFLKYPDNLPVLFPLMHNKPEQGEYKIHFAACSKS
jgi:Tfp pilus assembly protein PilZ